jgi:AGCS family alanine or glycine:cation symporter
MDFKNFINLINSLIALPYIFLLLGTGIFLTVGLRFLPVRKLPQTIRELIRGIRPESSRGDITPIQALTTELSATIGTGNIAGVATAIFLGGPGAVFWMWVCAFFGMATKFCESFLAVKYRQTLKDGTISGGPMWYILQGLKNRWLAGLFAFSGALSAFGIGNMAQSNSVALVLAKSWHIPEIVTGVVLATLTSLVIIGGIKRIGRITEFLVPFMSLLYIGAALLILLFNIYKIDDVFSLILTHAFSPIAATGGFAGAAISQAIRYGIIRGVFSNEAGLGSTPIAHAAAQTDSPFNQGLVSMSGIFFDTIIICSMTAFVILLFPDAWTSGENSSSLTSLAFNYGIPSIGNHIVTLSLATFAFSTIIGWSYYGEKCIQYLCGFASAYPYRLVYCLFVALGAISEVDVVWDLSDILNASMALPNLIALLFLSGSIFKEVNPKSS